MEPVDLSIRAKTVVSHPPIDYDNIALDLVTKDDPNRNHKIDPSKKESLARTVVLKVPHFQSLALQTLGLDLTLRTGKNH